MTEATGLCGLYGFFDDPARPVFKIVSALPRDRYALADHTDEIAIADQGLLLADARLFVSEHAAVTAAAQPTPAPAPPQPALAGARCRVGRHIAPSPAIGTPAAAIPHLFYL